MLTILTRAAVVCGGVLLALAGLPGSVRAADFDVVIAKGVIVPTGLQRGDGIGHGATISLAAGGLLVLRETAGCHQHLVFAGQTRTKLAASAYVGCPPAKDLADVRPRIDRGETLAERVVLAADAKADNPGGASLAGLDDPCLLLPRLSEEAGRNSRQCTSGYLVAGLQCSGSYCDDKRLRCCPYLGGRRDGAARHEPSHWISEETGPGRSNRFVSAQGFVSGLACRGRYCDDLLPRAVQSPRLGKAGSCSWTPFFSEEQGGWGSCAPGSYVSGLQCRGHYCDDLSLLCCPAQVR